MKFVDKAKKKEEEEEEEEENVGREGEQSRRRHNVDGKR